MLASCDASDPFMVTLIPGFNTILVVRTKEYIQDLSQFGFQFERLVTGRLMEGKDTDTISSVDHMHLMSVGKYRVFFCAETDATDEEGACIEIKASNPRYWGTKVMFQMISNGSTKLCHGVKSRGSLIEISLLSLEDVANKALGESGASATRLEERIINGMRAMKEQMATKSSGEAFKVSFVGNSLRLSKIDGGGHSADILPSKDVMKALMTLG